VQAFAEQHFLVVEAVGKKGDELRVTNSLNIISKETTWQNSATQVTPSVRQVFAKFRVARVMRGI
jgi:hypothetical protein